MELWLKTPKTALKVNNWQLFAFSYKPILGAFLRRLRPLQWDHCQDWTQVHEGGYRQSPCLHASHQAQWQEDLQQWHWRAIWSGKMGLGGRKWRENNWSWRAWTIRRPNYRLQTRQLQEPGNLNLIKEEKVMSGQILCIPKTIRTGANNQGTLVSEYKQ